MDKINLKKIYTYFDDTTNEETIVANAAENSERKDETAADQNLNLFNMFALFSFNLPVRKSYQNQRLTSPA